MWTLGPSWDVKGWLNYLNLSFDKLKILIFKSRASQGGNENTKKLSLSSLSFLCKWSNATLVNLLFSVINDNSTGKLPEVPLKTSSTKSYLSLVSFFSFPRLNNLELIPFAKALLLHGLNPRPLFYNNNLSQPKIVCLYFWSAAFIWPQTTLYLTTQTFQALWAR